MDEKELLATIKNLGWKGAWEAQLKGLSSKLSFLISKGRYQKLLRNIKTANDKNNFVASILEATIAFQFESAGIELDYEIRQDPNSTGSIDFSWKTAAGSTVFIEVRLLQQGKAPTGSTDGDDEKQDIVRVQGVILEKVQKKDGTPRKFLAMHKGRINIVAVDISQIVMGMFDSQDCKLVTFGDPSVRTINRRGVFGLFQEAMPEYPEHIRLRAQSYDHIRKTLHGVLFLFRKPKTELFNYPIQRFLAWNPGLMDKEKAAAICNEIKPALPLMRWT
jgi:hypothetical protein